MFFNLALLCMASLVHSRSTLSFSSARTRGGHLRVMAQGERAAQYHKVKLCSRRSVMGAGTLGTLSLGARPSLAAKRRDPVNRPDLLPKGEVTPLIDVTGMLSKSQEKLVKNMIVTLEKDTGLKLRVLCQTYPDTPGLAIADYWGVDPDTVVLVADPELSGNLLNFNVGENIDLQVPRNYWGRVSGKFGAKTYWQKEGADTAVVNAIGAIDSCVRQVGLGVRGACAPGSIKATDSAMVM
eukprot:jgi/Bigna1/47030/estExt_Genewise1.C_90118